MNFKRFEKQEPESVLNNTNNGIVDTSVENNVLTVNLCGKIDANNFEEIQNKAFSIFENEDIEEFVFDMDQVTYVSSAGLRMFSTINRKATEKDVIYKLVKMRKDIMKLFQMTGYASAFHINLKEE